MQSSARAVAAAPAIEEAGPLAVVQAPAPKLVPAIGPMGVASAPAVEQTSPLVVVTAPRIAGQPLPSPDPARLVRNPQTEAPMVVSVVTGTAGQISTLAFDGISAPPSEEQILLDVYAADETTKEPIPAYVPAWQEPVLD